MADYVVVSSTSNTITVINQPTTLVIGDSAMRGPVGPAGPAGQSYPEAYNQANAAYSQANAAYEAANSAGGSSEAYAQANSAYGQANAAYDQANSAYGQANAAYAEANSKLDLSGGTITGSLNVSGNLTISGNAKYTNVETYIVTDPLIYLAANNDTSDLVDIGFMGGHNTAGVYQHSGLIRHAADSTWYLFTGLADEGHINNIVDIANTSLATLRANINANNIVLVGNSVATQANLTLAHNQANNAYSEANVKLNISGGTVTGTLNLNGPGTALNVANDVFFASNVAIGRRVENFPLYVERDSLGVTAVFITEDGELNPRVVIYGNNQGSVIQQTYSANASNLIFSMAGSLGDGIEAMRITEERNVGIGEPNPVTKLHVNGSATFSEDVIVSGNIYLQGNTTFINVATLNITDPLIYLASNNQLSDTVDIGFMGGKNTAGVYSHTGLARDATDGKWKLFDGLPEEDHTENLINFANTYLATLVANVEANSITLIGNAVATQANVTLAYDTANAAYSQANAAYNAANNSANTVAVSQNSGSTLYIKRLNFVNTANVTVAVTDSGDGNANVAIFSVAGTSNPFDQSLNTTDSPTFDTISTSNVQTDSITIGIGGNINGQGSTLGNFSTINATAFGNDGDVTINANGVITTFGANGNLVFPDNTVQTTAYTGVGASLPLANGTSNIDIALANGYVTVTANAYTWTFNETNGLLELAGNVANFTACSAINFVANSSGDGEGYSTIELRPDSNATNDQYLIIDPTAPNHIHIRAGGQQDNSNGTLILGGENSCFAVASGENPSVSISANTFTWTFDPTDGFISFPDGSTQNTAFNANPVLDYTRTDNLRINSGVEEKYATIANANGTVVHNCANGHIFYHTTPTANWTANFTNLILSNGYATTLTLVIDQGATPYYANAVLIDSSVTTINWQGNTAPTPTANRKDVVSFSILKTGENSGNVIILGQLTGF